MIRLEIRHIDEVLHRLTEQDIAQIDSYANEKRRREVRAWRSLLRQMLEDEGLDCEGEIRYNDVGAPYIIGIERYFSVSHCATHIAIVISDVPCAVDIELKSRDFQRVAKKFCNEAEAQIIAHRLDVLWSAKETLYKLSGREGLDLLDDIQINAFDEGGAVVFGCVQSGESQRIMIVEDEHTVCAYCSSSSS